jgi:hypothetical protein
VSVNTVSMLMIALISVAGCSGSNTSPSGARSKITTSIGAGEITFSSPVGAPVDGGCMSVNSISTPTLDWVIQAMPGHTSTIEVDATSFHDAAPGCATSHLDTVPRPLVVTGPHVTYAPGETGTTTFSFEVADRCKDGGRYGIYVWALRQESSETDADRISTFTVVDCGFPSPPGIE